MKGRAFVNPERLKYLNAVVLFVIQILLVPKKPPRCAPPVANGGKVLVVIPVRGGVVLIQMELAVRLRALLNVLLDLADLLPTQTRFVAKVPCCNILRNIRITPGPKAGGCFLTGFNSY